jgi:hypothetical protein
MGTLHLQIETKPAAAKAGLGMSRLMKEKLSRDSVRKVVRMCGSKIYEMQKALNK